MEANTNYLSCKNTENPDVASQRAGQEVYVDLFSTKPNKYGLHETQLTQPQALKRANSNYLTLARSGTKAARAMYLLVLGPKKVARDMHLLLFGFQRVTPKQ